MRWIAFEKLCEPDTQYLCLFCMMASQNNEIYKLANIIKDLQTAIRCITSLQSSVTTNTPISDQTANIIADTPMKLTEA